MASMGWCLYEKHKSKILAYSDFALASCTQYVTHSNETSCKYGKVIIFDVENAEIVSS